MMCHYGCGCVCFIRKSFGVLWRLPMKTVFMDGTVKQTGEECMVVVQGDRVIAFESKEGA